MIRNHMLVYTSGYWIGDVACQYMQSIHTCMLQDLFQHTYVCFRQLRTASHIKFIPAVSAYHYIFILQYQFILNFIYSILKVQLKALWYQMFDRLWPSPNQF